MDTQDTESLMQVGHALNMIGSLFGPYAADKHVGHAIAEARVTNASTIARFFLSLDGIKATEFAHKWCLNETEKGHLEQIVADAIDHVQSLSTARLDEPVRSHRFGQRVIDVGFLFTLAYEYAEWIDDPDTVDLWNGYMHTARACLDNGFIGY